MSEIQDDGFQRATSEIRMQIRNNRQGQFNNKQFKSLVTTSKVSDKCSLCQTGLKADQAKICKFCGRTVCEECSPKKRQNPQKPEQFARICDRCDMSFIKNMLFGDQKTEMAKIASNITSEEEQLQLMRREFLDKQAEHQDLLRVCTKEREELEEKIEDIQVKIDRNNEKISVHTATLNEVNVNRKKQAECIKGLESKQTDLLDKINGAFFDKSELQRREKLVDSRAEVLKDFLVNHNANITHKNLVKNKMDSVLIRKANDSQFRESDYNVFQDTPGTPLDQFNFQQRSNSNLDTSKRFSRTGY